MSSLKLLFAEIRFRKINFLLSLLAVTCAATLFVCGPMLVEGYGQRTEAVLNDMDRESQESVDRIDKELAALDDATRKLMRDIGFNLVIVHEDTNMADFWADDFASADMPQEYIQTLANDARLDLVAHLVATLQSRIKWNDRTVLLVGYLPETTQSHREKKKPMGYNIQKGHILLGYELWNMLEFEPGQDVKDELVQVLGEDFKILGIKPKEGKGSKEDITIAMHLEDAQRLLKRPGRISQIMALGCRCEGERLPKIRQQLEAVLPQTKITEFQSIAVARAEQRDLVKTNRDAIAAEHTAARETFAKERGDMQASLATLAAVVTPLVVLACAVWVALLALANVRERLPEIGLLRALGRRSASIAWLFLSRAVLVGLLGGALGFAVGAYLSSQLAQRAFQLPDGLEPAYHLMGWTVLGAPALCALASYLPTLRALAQDPAVVLRDV